MRLIQMKESDLTSEKMENEAKARMFGSLGKELGKVPIRFALPIFFGNPKKLKNEDYLKSGTISLIKLECGLVGITCYHIIEEYRKRKQEDEETKICIGNYIIDLENNIIDENKKLDIVTINLNDPKFGEINHNFGIEFEFFTPIKWPPSGINEGNLVTLGGFPQIYRDNKSPGDIEFGSLSFIQLKINSVNEKYFVLQIEYDYLIESYNIDKRDIHDKKLGGISGSPAFIFRDLFFEFLGIVYEYSPEYNLLYIRCANIINSCGFIEKFN
jgi:hypothetical protein